MIHLAFKICSVGCGAMAKTGHGPSFQKYANDHADVVLGACCDINEESAKWFQHRFGFERAYADIDQMLSQEKPDAVSLVVPVHLTESLTVKLLEAHIPVILEKPPGMNRAQTLHMIEVANRTGTPNQVSFNRRFMPVVKRFQELRQGCSAQMWQYDFFRTGRRDTDFSTTSIHGIDTLRYLVGKSYRKVSFSYYPNPVDDSFVPTIILNCEFEDGETGRICFAPTAGIDAERCMMFGVNEMISASLPFHGVNGSLDGDGEIVVAREGKVVIRETMRKTDTFIANGFYGENKNFFDCIRNGIRPADDIASGFQAVEIADCIRQKKTSYTKSYFI